MPMRAALGHGRSFASAQDGNAATLERCLDDYKRDGCAVVRGFVDTDTTDAMETMDTTDTTDMMGSMDTTDTTDTPVTTDIARTQ